jgi:hypothetical protein
MDKQWIDRVFALRNTSRYEQYRDRAKDWGLKSHSLEANKIEYLRSEYADQGLQVFVKLFSVKLTPEQPYLDEGPWHQEGWHNERICACTYYCYHFKNVTTRVDFREALDTKDLNNHTNDTLHHDLMSSAYDTKDHGAALQELDQVRLRQGRVVTFPNVTYHRLSRVELRNKKRPGHAKIMVLSLVDPNTRILSTANVPPQQHGWWADRAMQYPPVTALPVELQNQIVKPVDDGPLFDMARAKALRETYRQQEDACSRAVEHILYRNRINYMENYRDASILAMARALRRENFGLPPSKDNKVRPLEPKTFPYAAFLRNKGLERLKAAREQAEAQAVARGATGGYNEDGYDAELRRTRELRRRQERRQHEEFSG